jgi:hypothetical protein
VRAARAEVANAWMIGCSDIGHQDSVIFAGLPLFQARWS